MINRLWDNYTCQYVVKFNKNIPEAGTSNVIVNYNDGSSAKSSTATVNYAGIDPVAGLTITSDNPNFDFSTRTNTPSQTAVVTLTNSGNSNESGFSFTSLASGFSTNVTGLSNPCSPSTVLAPTASCSVNLVYNNSAATAQTSDDITVNYKFGQHAITANSNIAVTYETVQSAAILGLSPNPASFANIANNNVENGSKILTLTNTGDNAATNVSKTLTGSNSNLFSVTATTCSTTLAAGANCSYTVKFGPSTAAAGSKTANLNVRYTPYAAATALTTSATLNGQVVAAQSANLAAVQTVHAGWAGGNGQTPDTAYAVQQNATVPTLSYTITNSGTVPANNFYLSGTPSNGWTMDDGCGSDAARVTKTLAANGGTCTVKFMLNTGQNPGGYDLELAPVTMNWVDQDTPTGESQALSGTVQALVYAPASIALTPTTASMAPGESAAFTATLTGGYQVVGDIVTVSNTSLVQGGSCPVSSSSPVCTISVTVPRNTLFPQDIQNLTIASQDDDIPVTITNLPITIGPSLASSGNGVWLLQTQYVPPSGESSAWKSPPLNHGGSSTLTATINYDFTTRFSYSWMVSSEQNYDQLEFYVDGAFQYKISGNPGWSYKDVALTAGAHDLAWRYVKDVSISKGADAGFIANMAVSSTLQP